MASEAGQFADDNPHAAANIIANEKILLSGSTIDARAIDATLLAVLTS